MSCPRSVGRGIHACVEQKLAIRQRYLILKTIGNPLVLLVWGGPGGNHRNVALERRLQGLPPGGAAPGLHSDDFPRVLPPRDAPPKRVVPPDEGQKCSPNGTNPLPETL